MLDEDRENLLPLWLTLLEVVGFPDVNTDKGHKLKLGEPLSGGSWQREEVSEVANLRVDEVPAQLAGPFGRLAGIKAAAIKKHKELSKCHNIALRIISAMNVTITSAMDE